MKGLSILGLAILLTNSGYSQASFSKDTIQTFKNMMAIERPIQPLLTRSVCIQAPTPFKRFLRYGQKTPIPKIHTERETQIATYKIHDTTWYEIYFKI